MKRIAWIVTALATIVGAAGCEPANQPAPAGITISGGTPPAGITISDGTPPAPPAAPGVVSGEAPPRLKKPSGYFTQAKIEEMLRDQLEAREISLRSAGGHDFTGTLKSGENTLTIKIKQVDGGIKWWHDNGRGGTGTFSWGNPVPD